MKYFYEQNISFQNRLNDVSAADHFLAEKLFNWKKEFFGICNLWPGGGGVVGEGARMNGGGGVVGRGEGSTGGEGGRDEIFCRRLQKSYN